MSTLKLTRVFKKKGATAVSSQAITVRKSEIVMTRPSNRLGKANHRSTVTLKSGVQLDLKEQVSSLKLDNWAFALMTRVYVQKAVRKGAAGTLKSQKILVKKTDIAMARASNRLGYPDHRATVTLSSGVQIDTADTAAKVQTLMG